jgi:hypothetical protein
MDGAPSQDWPHLACFVAIVAAPAKTPLYGGRAGAAAHFATPRSVIVRGRPRQAPGTCQARGADDRWLASAASQVAEGGLRLAEFAGSPLHEARQTRKAKDQPARGELRVCGVVSSIVVEW